MLQKFLSALVLPSIASMVFLTACSDEDHACNPSSLPTRLDHFFEQCGETLKSYGIKASFHDGVLTGVGKSYREAQFQSPFAAQVFLLFKDIERSKIIMKAYTDHLEHWFSGTPEEEHIYSWLDRIQNFIGGKNITNEWMIKQITPSTLESYILVNMPVHNAVNKFLDQVRTETTTLGLPAVDAAAPDKVDIITGPYGSGHSSVAGEIKAALDLKNIDNRIINECDEFLDPLAILTEKSFRGCRIYNDIQVSQQNASKAAILKHFRGLISFYIVPDERGQLRRALQANNPKLLISTVHQLGDITGLAYMLDRPLFIAVTDFEFPVTQWTEFNNVDDKYVRYLIPRKDSLFFRRMFKQMQEEGISYPPIDTQRSHILYESLFDKRTHTELTPDLLDKLKVFRIVGFPVNPMFRFPKSAADIPAARAQLKFDLDPTRKIVTVTFGGTPTKTDVKSALDFLISKRKELKYKIQINVLAADNADVENFVREKLAKATIREIYDADFGKNKSYPDKMVVKILPRQPRENMAAMNLASDAVMSKAGGATTAELLHSSTFYLRTTALNSWEVENALYLERLGLGPKTDASLIDNLNVDYSPYKNNPPMRNLMTQLNEILGRPRIIGKNIDGFVKYERDDLLNAIREMITNFSK